MNYKEYIYGMRENDVKVIECNLRASRSLPIGSEPELRLLAVLFADRTASAQQAELRFLSGRPLN